LEASPQSNFQQATLYIYQNADNYLAINRGFCGPCSTGGNGIFMEYKFSGDVKAYMFAFTPTDLYLRLLNQAHSVTGYYGTDPADLQRIGSVGNFFEHFDICLGASNADHAGLNEDLLGRFDYFEITQP
jgi:hypothetical protein